jgi:hypothetical protein
LLIDAALPILLRSETYPGRTHDKRIADATPYPLPMGSRVLQDLGCLAFTLHRVERIMPTREAAPDTRAESRQSAGRAPACAPRPRSQPLAQGRCPRSGHGRVRCASQLSRASAAVATDGLIEMNSTYNSLLAPSTSSVMRLSSKYVDWSHSTYVVC